VVRDERKEKMSKLFLNFIFIICSYYYYID
jgi:hypothetical protein